MSKAVMQEAVWALKDLISAYPETACIETRIGAQKVIAALEAELAKPEQPEQENECNPYDLCAGCRCAYSRLAQPEQKLDYPPECTTPELKVAYAAGWWKALEVQRNKQQALDKKAANARELGLDYEPDAVQPKE